MALRRNNDRQFHPHGGRIPWEIFGRCFGTVPDLAPSLIRSDLFRSRKLPGDSGFGVTLMRPLAHVRGECR